MNKIVLKESEIRGYVRSLIREAMEMEGKASQKTINKWLNATTPEQIMALKPGKRQNPEEFEDLRRMALRQPYYRTHFREASRDIEDAWRKHNGLPSLKNLENPITGKGKGRKIYKIDADGNPIFDVRSEETKNAYNNAQTKAKAKEKRAIARSEREAQKVAQKAEQERLSQEQREAQKMADVIKWCEENNVDPASPNAEAMYDKHYEELSRQRDYERGEGSEFTADRLKRKIAWLKKRIAETEFSTDTWDQKVCDSCEYVLKDTERILRQNFNKDGTPKRNLRNATEFGLTNQQLNDIGKEGKEAAISSMQKDFNKQNAEQASQYANNPEFVSWCKENNCDPKPSTENVYNEYISAYKSWCEDNGYDPSNLEIRRVYDLEYADDWSQQIQAANEAGQLIDMNGNNQTSNSNNESDYEVEYIDDDDNGRGDDYRRTLGQLDDVNDIDMREFEEWCIENEYDPDDERSMEIYKRMNGNTEYQFNSNKMNDVYDMDDY